jgi:peptidoglycan/xylan/chitin deacetylase (PgdA/CDA1 family)
MNSAPRLPVLLYHAVGTARDRRFGRWAVAPEQLRDQLETLANAGYGLLPLTEAVGAAKAGERVVAVTFDDGYSDFVEQALPILNDLEARATLYAVTGYVGQTAGWLPFPAERARPLLDWSELRALSASGHEVAPHGHRHLALDTLPPQEVRTEIDRSAAAIAQETGRSASSFSYPFGYHSPQVRRMVSEAGIRLACEVGYAVHRVDGDPLRISRLLATPSMDGQALLRKVQGPARPVGSQARELLRPWWRTARRAHGVIAAGSTS